MTTQAKLDWQTTGTDAAQELSAGGARVIAVGDEVVGYTATLPPGMSAADALRDFASTYDAGDYTGPIDVDWQLWEGGEVLDSGDWQFTMSDGRIASLSYLAPSRRSEPDAKAWAEYLAEHLDWAADDFTDWYAWDAPIPERSTWQAEVERFNAHLAELEGAGQESAQNSAEIS